MTHTLYFSSGILRYTLGQPGFGTGPADWIELVGWIELVDWTDVHDQSGAASMAVGHWDAKESGGKHPGNNMRESSVTVCIVVLHNEIGVTAQIHTVDEPLLSQG